MSEKEVDLEAAKPALLAKEKTSEERAAEAVRFFKGEEETPLHPKEISEELLARLYDNMQEADMLAKLIEQDKKDVKELGRGSETIQRGKYVAILKSVKGRKSVAWARLAKAMIGNLSDDDLEKYTETGDESVRLEIRKLD